MKRTVLLGVFAFLISVSCSHAQSTYITPYSEFQSWLPVVFLAVLFSVSITAIYYVAGVVLQNKRVRSSAVIELGQAIGTAIITVAMIGILVFVGTSEFSLVSLLSPFSVNVVCNQLGASQLQLLNSKGVINGNAVPTNIVCANVKSLASGSIDITQRLDYGLFSSYVILANVTNQAAENLNSLYVFEGWIGFLSKFRSYNQVCTALYPTFPLFGAGCMLPLVQRAISIVVNYDPMAGYSTLSTISGPMELAAGLTFYLLFMQLMAITILLFAWPYFLAGGIILRSTLFTRKLGGLLMAISLAAVLMAPIMYVLEYTAFTNLKVGPIGTNNLPGIPLYERLPDGNVIIYGASSTGGYVDVGANHGNLQSATGWAEPSGCSSGYVYEFQCGNPDSAGSTCFSSVSSSAPKCRDVNGGWVPASWASTSLVKSMECKPGQYVFENTCGNPKSVEAAAGCSDGADLIESVLCMPDLRSNVNFFILPNAGEVIDYYSCMPSDRSLFIGEVEFAAHYLIPFYGAGLGLISGIGGAGGIGTLPVTPLAGCSPDHAINTVLALTNMYGIVFVIGVVMPLMNVMIAIAATVGLSRLFGGDTDIAGIGKLV